MFEDSKISLLLGKTLTKVTATEDEIRFECSDGSNFMLYHMQDCCERVRVFKTDGDWADLIGKQIESTWEETITDGNPPGVTYSPSRYDSYTWTVYTIRAAGASVDCIWLGVSNGYYSESVYFQRTH